VRSSWLMLAGNCDLCLLASGELAALVLDLVEQPHVLDRDDRLVSEGRRQLDLLVGEGPYRLAAQNDKPLGFASRRSGTPSMVWKPVLPEIPTIVYSGSACTSRI
jgi:hypothetical protein